MASGESYFQLSQYSASEVSEISAMQVAVTSVSALFANYLLPNVTIISSTLLSLKIFTAVFGTLSFILVRARSKSSFSIGQVLKLLLSIIVFTVVFYVIAVMYGASLLENTEETFHFALVMAVLIAVPTGSLLGADPQVWQKVFYSNWGEQLAESYSLQCIAVTILGAWVGAFPIPLDWDRPWQAWPITCVIGAVVGHVTGLVTAAITFYINEKRLKEKFKLV